MKISLPLKLGIFVILVFAAVVSGMLLYQPLRYAWLESRLLSKDDEQRNKAIKTVSEDGKKAIPHLRRWLKSDDDALIIATCRIIEAGPEETKKTLRPELDAILREAPSKRTDTVITILYGKNLSGENYYTIWQPLLMSMKDARIRRNICIYIIRNVDSYVHRLSAMQQLEETGDTYAENELSRIIHGRTMDEEDINEFVRCGALSILAGINQELAVEQALAVLSEKYPYPLRNRAVYILGSTGDPEVVEPLIGALTKDPECTVRWYAAIELGHIGDQRAVYPLIHALSNDPDPGVRRHAAGALGDLGNSMAVDALLDALLERKILYAAEALGQIADNRVVPQLIKLLEDPQYINTLPSLIPALGAIGDERAVGPLISVMDNTSWDYNACCAAQALARFETEKVFQALLKAAESGNSGAHVALAWQKGGDFLKTVRIRECPTTVFALLYAAQAKWRNPDVLDIVIDNYFYTELEYFHSFVYSLMPDGFPAINFEDPVYVRKKQAKTMREWYKKNRNLLAWNMEEKKYFLKPNSSVKNPK
ncbi:MAG: HEAT repeat domain-containing protein [Planctomycetota bacterium]|jgi:HEAT repeat protein